MRNAKFSLVTKDAFSLGAHLIAVGVPSKATAKKSLFSKLSKSTGLELQKLADGEKFKAGRWQTLKVPFSAKSKSGWLLLVGLGDDKASSDDARVVAVCAGKSVRGHTNVALLLGAANADDVRSASSGFLEGAYDYTAYKTDAKKKRSTLSVNVVVNKQSAALKKAMTQGADLGISIAYARDLVNAPPNDLNPITLAKSAAAEAKKIGLKCDVWNKARIKKEKMELFLAVNRGSAIEPRLIHVTYKPTGAKKKICFVGKGLTFDAGGLCLKPGKSMLDMKCDMAGAATTLGIVFAAARMKLPVEVHAVVGSTENMLGAEAYRPGDVFKTRSGKTVEIINTDAEGRNVLADVLSWAVDKLKADLIVDHATLTGACMVALGPRRAGLWANDDSYANRYLRAADDMTEKYWRLPLDEDLRKGLDSQIADLKHLGGPYGGSTTAALFLREFVGNSKWIHCDIAGPAFLSAASGRYPKGGTGFGVATGVRFLESLKK